jgi:hypothetical protein
MAGQDVSGTEAGPGYAPPEIDITEPSVARVYDAILGGKENFAADRAVAKQALAVMGDGGKGARLNRAALGRAVRLMITEGLTQFLDLGSGLPTAQNTHQIACALNPAARVVYVDNDPSVYDHGQAMIAGAPSARVVLGDIREPDTLLAMPEVVGFLDFTKPVGLILNAVIHHVLDEEGPFQIVDRYKEALAPGSYLQLTHFIDASHEAQVNEKVLRRSLGRGQTRTREQIARFFRGLDLVPPGLVYLAEWRPDEPVRLPLDPGSMLMLAGVGRKP